MTRLIPIESGWMTCATEIMCAGGCEGEGERVRFPVSCWLIEHDAGLVLFDTGMHASLMNDPSRIGAAADIFEIEMAHTLGEAIRAQGFDPADIDLIVFSHLHFDHCGGTDEVPNARLVVQKDEWDAAHNSRNVELGIYLPADVDLGHAVQTVEGRHDVFGDGSVVCLPTPGHTAGHQCLRVELPSGPVLLVGDCCYFASMLEELRLPMRSFDAEQQVASMKQLLDLQASGVTLLFGHDRAQWDSLGLRPLT